MQFLFFTGFAGVTFGLSLIFFYIFNRSEERYVQYLGLCWLLYTGSILFLTLSIIFGDSLYISVRNILDLFNVLFLLYSAYAFASRKAPGIWLRFSLYISIWFAVSVHYEFDKLSVILPVSFYQIVLTSVIVYVIARFWNISFFTKIIFMTVFAIWGMGKSILGIISLSDIAFNLSQFYVTEVLFSNILSFIILILYFQRSQKKLNAIELITHTITENATDVLFLYENEDAPLFSYVTPSVKNLIGITPEAFYADSQVLRAFIDSDDMDEISKLLSFDGDDEKQTTIRIYDREFRMHWCEISTQIIREEYEPAKIEGVIHDVTASIEAHNQLIKSKEERDILLSYVSHELKTPLTSILGYVTALRDDTVTDMTQRREMLDLIYNKSLTLDKLIFDLVQLSKLETHQFPLDFSLVKCRELADTLISGHVHDGDDFDITIEYSISDRIRSQMLAADVDRIDQVFTNLISNALRFTEKGNKINVEFDLNNDYTYFTFSVTNYGSIISREDLTHIFDRFYRVKKGQPSANERSSGLGLTISKELILAHNGNIDAESNPTHGTVFTVSIPLFDETKEN